MPILVNIDVPDLEQAIGFYTQGLGLRVGRRFGPDFAELLGADAPIYLLGKKAGTVPFDGATERRTYDRHWSPVHLDFVVDDIDAAIAKAKAAGAVQESEVSEHDYGTLALMADPFGNGVLLAPVQRARLRGDRDELTGHASRAGLGRPHTISRRYFSTENTPPWSWGDTVPVV